MCTKDWCSCAAVCCCLPITTSQLYVRFLYKGNQKLRVFVLLTLFLFTGLICTQLSQLVLIAQKEGKTVLISDEGTDIIPQPLLVVISFLGLAASFFVCYITMNVRNMVRLHDDIGEKCCIGTEDCCCAVW